MPVVTRRQLLESGVHFGHQTRRWNPKMRRYIYGERGGIYVIDLEKTLAGVERAYEFVRDLARRGGIVLFVGTKKQAQDIVAEQASRTGMPYVNTRWLGGMLTNFQTINRRLQRLKELREMERSGAFDFLPKKEVLKLRHEKEKLERNLGGIQELERVPDAVYLVDTKKEHIAVTEANKLGIPLIAIVDTNCDPDEVDFVIPGNDDAIRAISLVTTLLAEAIEEGRRLRTKDVADRAEAAAQPETAAAATEARAAEDAGGAEAGPGEPGEPTTAEPTAAEPAAQAEEEITAEPPAAAPATEEPASEEPATEERGSRSRAAVQEASPGAEASSRAGSEPE